MQTRNSRLRFPSAKLSDEEEELRLVLGSTFFLGGEGGTGGGREGGSVGLASRISIL